MAISNPHPYERLFAFSRRVFMDNRCPWGTAVSGPCCQMITYAAHTDACCMPDIELTSVLN